MFHRTLSIAALALMLAPATAHSTTSVGQPAFDFTKNQLVGGAAGPAWTLSDQRGKVVVLSVLGFSCSECLTDGPSVEADLWQFYETSQPGKVVVVGADIWDGSPADLAGFRNTTGATYPLLLNAGTASGGNLVTAYFDRDNYVIIDQFGIERFSARQQGYSFGRALDVTRMRGLIDSLLTHTAGVGDPGVPAPVAPLTATPNPFRDRTRIDATLPVAATGALEISVLDLSGRRVASLSARSAAGRVSAAWDGRDTGGRLMPSGVYLVRAHAGGMVVTSRVVLLR
jgi:FlgD Ig-like domain